MKTYENSEMKVTIKENGTGVVEIKRFGDRYGVRIINNKIVAYSAVGLSKAIKARDVFGF